MILFTTGCLSTNSDNNFGKPTLKTPYDEKYEKIQKYLKKAQNFTYRSDQELFYIKDYWQNPDEIEINQAGDCEDKSLWLYSKLIKEGFSDIRLVIGKFNVNDVVNHMWVAWYTNDGVFILDATSKYGPIKIINLPENYYKPLYSYYKNQKWEHIS